MGGYIVSEVVKLMINRGLSVARGRILILGLTFKENCPDLRNTRVVDMIKGFQGYRSIVDVHDPWVDANEAMHEYGIQLTEHPGEGEYDAVVLAVAHRQFVALGAEKLRALCKPDGVLYDVKHILPAAASDGRL